jgi:AraC-like DNA-binding protein
MLLVLAALLSAPGSPAPAPTGATPASVAPAVIPLLELAHPVDGNLAKWKGIPATRFAVSGTPVAVRLAWNDRALLALFEVGDTTSVTGGTEDEDPELGRKSDSVELFVDGRNEHSKRMDTNDYQFTVSRDGRRTTYKGSAALGRSASSRAPKDWGMNIPVEVATVDGPEAGPSGGPGYRVEIAVPWMAIGVNPRPAMELGLDVAVNDVFPEGAGVGLKVLSADWRGSAEFESPGLWTRTTLGAAGALKSLLHAARPWAAGAAALLALVAAWLLGRRFVKGPRASAPVAAPASVETGATPGDDPVERLRRSLGPRLREELTAESLAELAGVSLRTLQRLFRDRFRTSPMNWLIEVRLQEAARLIREGDDPVTKIAYRVGFKDPSHFTRRFKARFGVSPNEFRRAEPGATAAPGDAGEEPE